MSLLPGVSCFSTQVSSKNLHWPQHNNSTLTLLTLWSQKVTVKACLSSCQSTKRHLFSTEPQRKTIQHPVRSCWPERRQERKRATETTKTEILEEGERRWSAGSQGVSQSSRKVSPAMPVEPKWRRAECSVATDDERHIYRMKIMMKNTRRGREEPEETD